MADGPRSREELIEGHLSDDAIIDILEGLKERASRGDWNAAKLLIEFRFGKNPEPPHTGMTLEDLMAASPTGIVPGPDDI